MKDDPGTQAIQVETSSLSKRVAGALPVALIALGLGLAAERLFYDRAAGLSFPLWVMLGAVGLLLAARVEGARPARDGLILLLPTLALSWMTFLRSEPFTVFLSAAGTLFGLALWVRTFRTGGWLGFGWLDFILAGIWVPLESWLRPWPTLAAAWRRAVGEKGSRSRGAAVLRGVLLALPALAVFTALLASADLIFGQWVELAFSWLDLEWLMEALGRLIFALIVALFSLGAIVSALLRAQRRPGLGEEKPLIKPFIGFIESAIVLGAVDVLFLLFVLVQFRYFFGGEANISLAGYTYSEYARRGFGELVTVAALSLGLILMLGYVGRREGHQKRAFFGLSALQVALVGVMLISALERLLLYENAYGFTRLRTYTHVFIPWLALLLVSFLLMLYLGQLRRFAPAAVLAVLGFTLTLGLLNVDAFIARQNIRRYETGGGIDVPYLASLSTDALPLLVELARRAELDVSEELLPALACHAWSLENRLEEQGWPSLHHSQSTALRSLKSLEALDPYKIVRDEEGFWVANGPEGTMVCGCSKNSLR